MYISVCDWQLKYVKPEFVWEDMAKYRYLNALPKCAVFRRQLLVSGEIRYHPRPHFTLITIVYKAMDWPDTPRIFWQESSQSLFSFYVLSACGMSALDNFLQMENATVDFKCYIWSRGLGIHL